MTPDSREKDTSPARRILGRLVRVVAAYAASCLGATLFFVLLVFVPWTTGFPLDELPLLLPIAAVGSVFVFGLALPVALVVVLYAEYRSIQRCLYFAAAGAVGGLWWLPFSAFRNSSQQTDLEGTLLIGASVLAGVAGGIIYWALAGKQSGTWRQASGDQTA